MARDDDQYDGDDGKDLTVPLTVPYAQGVQPWYNTAGEMEMLLKEDFLGWHVVGNHKSHLSVQ
jgi:hypothetical protein